MIRTTELGNFCSIPAGNSITRRAAPPNVELGGKGLKLKYQQKNKPLCVLYGLLGLSALDLYGDSDVGRCVSATVRMTFSRLSQVFKLIYSYLPTLTDSAPHTQTGKNKQKGTAILAWSYSFSACTTTRRCIGKCSARRSTSTLSRRASAVG